MNLKFTTKKLKSGLWVYSSRDMFSMNQKEVLSITEATYPEQWTLKNVDKNCSIGSSHRLHLNISYFVVVISITSLLALKLISISQLHFRSTTFKKSEDKSIKVQYFNGSWEGYFASDVFKFCDKCEYLGACSISLVFYWYFISIYCSYDLA